jgi:uncharacterized protein YneF (UPF0154 family)
LDWLDWLALATIYIIFALVAASAMGLWLSRRPR